jgi:hypothetical protein
MVAVKGGLLVTKIKGPSSVVNNMMQKLSGIKRMMLKRGKTGEVLQIGESDNIESIDLSNLENLSTLRVSTFWRTWPPPPTCQRSSSTLRRSPRASVKALKMPAP